MDGVAKSGSCLMRIDYIEVQDSDTVESTFVEAHWTEVWEKEGGPRGQLRAALLRDRAPRQPLRAAGRGEGPRVAT